MYISKHNDDNKCSAVCLQVNLMQAVVLGMRLIIGQLPTLKRISLFQAQHNFLHVHIPMINLEFQSDDVVKQQFYPDVCDQIYFWKVFFVVPRVHEMLSWRKPISKCHMSHRKKPLSQYSRITAANSTQAAASQHQLPVSPTGTWRQRCCLPENLRLISSHLMKGSYDIVLEPRQRTIKTLVLDHDPMPVNTLLPTSD